MDGSTSTPHTYGSNLSVTQLRAKTIWIRDELEPVVARHGPEYLESDTILELASFFSFLLAHSTHLMNVPGASSPSLIVFNRAEGRQPTLSLYDLQVSRIHMALLLITGKGTRWPMKLVELCDSLKRVWSAKFGDLTTIRPLLYEKGGPLHHVREEKDMSRHAVLVKWMSDHTSIVSPLHALDSGHLGHSPGEWWIHPLFAFHAGIIDSPDPHGGISADRDAAYAITMTGKDEVESQSLEFITYRARNDDRGRHRLIQTSLPPQQSIRVLRSHTLTSLSSPIVGLRYEGLYKVVGWGVVAEGVNDIGIHVNLRRESGQVDIKEVEKHPTSEEFDAYVEYKRLRSIRLGKQRDMSKTFPKSDQILGTIPALNENSHVVEVEKEAMGDFPSSRRGAIYPEDQESILEDQSALVAASPRNIAARGDWNETVLEELPSLDGTVCHLQKAPSTSQEYTTKKEEKHSELDPPCQDPMSGGHSVSVRECCEDSDAHLAAEMYKTNLGQQSSSESEEGQSTYELASQDYQWGDILSLSHSELRSLKAGIARLRQRTQNRGAISKSFHQDLTNILDMVKQLENSMIESHGLVDRCVSDLAGQLQGLIREVSLSEPPTNSYNIMPAVLESASRSQKDLIESLRLLE